MKPEVKYHLYPAGYEQPVGFFLNNVFFGQPFGDKIPQGHVDENGKFNTFVVSEMNKSPNPVGEVQESKFIRYSDGEEFTLKEEN